MRLELYKKMRYATKNPEDQLHTIRPFQLIVAASVFRSLLAAPLSGRFGYFGANLFSTLSVEFSSWKPVKLTFTTLVSYSGL